MVEPRRFLCQTKKHWNGRAKTGKRAKHRALRRASLFVKKCITSVKASMARVLQNRRLPLVCQKRGEQELNCVHQPKARFRKKPAAAPPAHIAKGSEGPDLPQNVRGLA